MKVNIIAIGKPSKEYAVLIKEYEGRLDGFCSLAVVECKAEKMLPVLKGTVVILDSYGIQFSSEGLANFLKDKEELTFVIGGDTGFSAEMKKKADLLLSFSKMTMPHQLARLVVTEQVYRAFSIIKKSPYHK